MTKMISRKALLCFEIHLFIQVEMFLSFLVSSQITFLFEMRQRVVSSGRGSAPSCHRFESGEQFCVEPILDDEFDSGERLIRDQ